MKPLKKVPKIEKAFNKGVINVAFEKGAKNGKRV